MSPMLASAVLTAHAQFDPADLASGFNLGILADARDLNADEVLARTYDPEMIGSQTIEIGFTSTAALEQIAGTTVFGLANGSRAIKFAEFTALVIRIRKKWPAAGVFGSVDVSTTDLGYDPALVASAMPDLHFRDFAASSVARTSNSAFNAQFTLPGGGDTISSITGVASTDLITATGHVWCEGLPLALSGLTGGSGLANGNYYLRDLQPDGTFKLSATSGGDPVDFTTDITAGSLVPRFANLLLDFVLFGNR